MDVDPVDLFDDGESSMDVEVCAYDCACMRCIHMCGCVGVWFCVCNYTATPKGVAV
jgi:hypothetical protein